MDDIDLSQAHRFDEETPLEETMAAFADLVRQSKVLHLGVSEGRADQIEAATALPGRPTRKYRPEQQQPPAESRATSSLGGAFVGRRDLAEHDSGKVAAPFDVIPAWTA
ncbi:aldo/keto reductase [Nonomuraea sp. NPDC050328]|uniref:aldo/keto reductase n=1 Tax=Nonomuraea sp. NPDC050328 TaxID=3364361 RepID=UPI0037AD58BA